MLAVPGPTRGSASRNEAIGTTVATSASAMIAATPEGSSAEVASAPAEPPKLSVPSAAPVTTSVASSSPSTRAVKRSASST